MKDFWKAYVHAHGVYKTFCVRGFNRRKEIMQNTKLYVVLVPVKYTSKYRGEKVKMDRTCGTCGLEDKTVTIFCPFLKCRYRLEEIIKNKLKGTEWECVSC
jgi:hypothetical protein